MMTADDSYQTVIRRRGEVGGLRYRPDWKPGAAHKALVRKYRQVRGQEDIQAKKRKAMLKRSRRKDVMKPTLVVKKVDGEYTVQMEVMKKYSNDRMVFQYPYDDKPPVNFTVGRTEKENEKREMRKERSERRKQRRQSKYIQSTFRDMCEEICLQTYKQAIGLLPKPNPNDPSCPCYPENPDQVSLIADSCSCSDSNGDSSSTETDGDDWVIEFTPPAARYKPDAKHPSHNTDNECQYNYVDYRVKVLDKNGNQVQRFFTGPDGKQVCSDLGGFWGPNHIWQEIGKDGYIGVDSRWVPMGFFGPDGAFVNAEDGFFTDVNGKMYNVGVDGYVGKDGKWIFYGKQPLKRSQFSKTSDEASTWTCLANIPQSDVADKISFVPHGRDKYKLKKQLEETDFKMPQGKVVPKFRGGKEINQRNAPDKGLKSKQSVVTIKGKGPPRSTPSSGKPGVPNLASKGEGRDRSATPPGKAGASTGRGKAPGPAEKQRAGSGKGNKGKTTSGKSGGKDVVSKGSSKTVTLKNKNTVLSSRSPARLPDKYRRGKDQCDFGYEDKNKRPMDRRRNDEGKICKLARMKADGRRLSPHHKECFKEIIGECCMEKGGLCMDVFE